jgi:bleomycin hydrolase
MTNKILITVLITLMVQIGYKNYVTVYYLKDSKDKSGEKYYILKDSQGNDKFLNGYIYLSESYVKLKTVSVMTHRKILEKVVRN